MEKNENINKELQKLRASNFALQQEVRKEKEEIATIKNEKAKIEFEAEIGLERQFNKIKSINASGNNSNNTTELASPGSLSPPLEHKNSSPERSSSASEPLKIDTKHLESFTHKKSVVRKRSSGSSEHIKLEPAKDDKVVKLSEEAKARRRRRSRSLPPVASMAHIPRRVYASPMQSNYYEALQETWVFAHKGGKTVFKRYYCVLYSNEEIHFYNNESLFSLEFYVRLSDMVPPIKCDKANFGVQLVDKSRQITFINFPSRELNLIWHKVLTKLLGE